MMNRIVFVLLLACSTFLPAQTTRGGSAQGGDQFLDGIGETGLIARYVLSGNAEDSSRNQFHAELRGSGGAFVEDSRFGRALLLPGNGACVRLPGHALAGEDTISVTGWLYLMTGATGHVFDFGQGPSSRIFAAVTEAGFRAAIAGGATRGETEAAPVPQNQWVHFAVVLDPVNRLLTSYIDGTRAGQATNVGVNAVEVVAQDAGERNGLYIGRAQEEASATLHARVRDFRVYRIALTGEQVATIRNNALTAPAAGARRSGPPAVVPTDAIPKQSPLASRLKRVPDIEVETIVGHLPRLPYTIPAIYADGARGPDVRVIWPAPRDNSDVTAPGTYTVTGSVPGTPFKPRATVRVKPASGVAVPSRAVEPFGLGQVVLDRDTKGRETPFVRNRDKFVKKNRVDTLTSGTELDSATRGNSSVAGQPDRACRHARELMSAIAQAYASATMTRRCVRSSSTR